MNFVGMPRKFKFQHRKKRDRQLRIARLTAKLPIVCSSYEQTSVDTDSSLLIDPTMTSPGTLTPASGTLTPASGTLTPASGTLTPASDTLTPASGSDTLTPASDTLTRTLTPTSDTLTHTLTPASDTAHSASDEVLPPTQANNFPTALQIVHSSLALPSRLWSDHSADVLDEIVLCKVSCNTRPLSVTHSLTVNSDLLWTLFINEHRVDSNTSSALKSFTGSTNAEELARLLNLLDGLHICAGHPEDHFVRMLLAKKSKTLSHNGKVAAYVDNTRVELNGQTYLRTVRTSGCEITSNLVKCLPCSKYRSNLRSMYYKWSKRHLHTQQSSVESSSDSSKYKNERYLDTPEKIASLRKRAYTAEQTVMKLRAKICKLTKEQGEMLDDNLHSDLVGIMNDNGDKIKQAYPEGSFARLFWEEQLKAATVSDARQVRWHPVIIKWCLNLKLMSSAAYHALRTSGFIKLPSERTLRDYTHYFVNKPGFQDEVNQQMVDEIKKMSIDEPRKYVALLVDEMKVKEGLVYNKNCGEVIGFVNLGDINQQLLILERQEDEHPPVAKQILALMVRGMMFKLEFPYAHFGTCGVTGEMLYSIVWEAIRRLEASEIKVICVTADGASPNRKFFRMHHAKNDPSRLTYKALNPYSVDERWVYFIADPPHLMKTVRNCWSHSGFAGTRHMKVSDIHV